MPIATYTLAACETHRPQARHGSYQIFYHFLSCSLHVAAGSTRCRREAALDTFTKASFAARATPTGSPDTQTRHATHTSTIHLR